MTERRLFISEEYDCVEGRKIEISEHMLTILQDTMCREHDEISTNLKNDPSIGILHKLVPIYESLSKKLMVMLPPYRC